MLKIRCSTVTALPLSHALSDTQEEHCRPFPLICPSPLGRLGASLLIRIRPGHESGTSVRWHRELATRWRPVEQRRAVGGLVVVFGVRRPVREHGRAGCAPGQSGLSRRGTYKTIRSEEHTSELQSLTN